MNGKKQVLEEEVAEDDDSAAKEEELYGEPGEENLEEEEKAGGDSEPEDKKENDELPVVPEARFHEVVADRNSAKAELEALKIEKAKLEGMIEGRNRAGSGDSGGEEQAEKKVNGWDESDLDDALEKQANAISDGDTKGYTTVSKQINEYYSAKNAVSPAPAPAAVDENALMAKMRMAEVEEAAVAAHPLLDSDSAEFDKQIVGDVLAWHKVELERGAPADVALQSALSKFVPGYGSNGTNGANIDGEAEAKRKAALLARQPGRQSGGVTPQESSDKEKLKNWDNLSDKARETVLFSR